MDDHIGGTPIKNAHDGAVLLARGAGSGFQIAKRGCEYRPAIVAWQSLRPSECKEISILELCFAITVPSNRVVREDTVGKIEETEAKYEAKGLGKASPVASNDTPAGRQRNRRVEIVVSGELIGTQTESHNWSVKNNDKIL